MTKNLLKVRQPFRLTILKMDKLIENVFKYKIDQQEINIAVVKQTIYDLLGSKEMNIVTIFNNNE